MTTETKAPAMTVTSPDLTLFQALQVWMSLHTVDPDSEQTRQAYRRYIRAVHAVSTARLSPMARLSDASQIKTDAYFSDINPEDYEAISQKSAAQLVDTMIEDTASFTADLTVALRQEITQRMVTLITTP